MTIFFWGVIISVLIYLVVGLLAGRRVKDTSDYYVCGRNAPTLLITGTLFASMLSVSGFTGDQGWCYSGNITSLVLLNAICACGYVFGALVFGRYLRRSECTTMPEYFGTRFHDVRNRQVAGGITVISLTAYLLSSITGVGILMEELTAAWVGVPADYLGLLHGLYFLFRLGGRCDNGHDDVPGIFCRNPVFRLLYFPRTGRNWKAASQSDGKSGSAGGTFGLSWACQRRRSRGRC